MGYPTRAALADADVERINAEYCFDRPIPVQFGIFVRQVLIGELGNSTSLKVPVAQLIVERLPVTMLLTLMAALISVALTQPIYRTPFRTGGLHATLAQVFE